MKPVFHAREYKEVLLSIEGLSLKLGDNQILRDITIDVKNIIRPDRPDIKQGQVIAFLGPSGMGKTQFLLRMAGLEKPTEGRILISTEKDPTLRPVEAGQVGVVFQNYYMDPTLTVIETLVRAGKQTGQTQAEARERAKTFLQKFGLSGREKFYPAQLSGGQRQRVAIIEQMMCSEHILLMDEPFSGLDYAAKENACELINDLAKVKEENTIIVVTHDIDTALQVADTVWLLGRDRDAQGKIIPGARIVETIDLVALGLAWVPGIQFADEFITLVRDIKARFIDPNGPYAKD